MILVISLTQNRLLAQSSCPYWRVAGGAGKPAVGPAFFILYFFTACLVGLRTSCVTARSTRGLSLIIQLQGELNLSRIVGRITSRINLAKIRTLEVERAWGGNHVAPAGKSRGVEVWMIENVEEFPAELQTEAFGETEILEN